MLFNIANQSGRWERFSVVRRNGRRVAQTPPIPDGGTAQLKANLRDSTYAFVVSSLRAGSAQLTYVRLSISGRPRSGDRQLMQP